MPKQCPRDFRERAIRLVNESVGDHETEWATVQRVLSRLGVSGETVRKWVRQAEVNAGLRPGVNQSESAEIRRANEILRTAAAFFAADLDRPASR